MRDHDQQRKRLRIELRVRGLRWTQTRAAIVANGTLDHLSHGQPARGRGRHPHLSAPSDTRYGMAHPAHYHFVCRGCGAVLELAGQPINAALAAPRRRGE